MEKTGGGTPREKINRGKKPVWKNRGGKYLVWKILRREMAGVEKTGPEKNRWKKTGRGKT